MLLADCVRTVALDKMAFVGKIGRLGLLSVKKVKTQFLSN